jgi:hypothetical protein
MPEHTKEKRRRSPKNISATLSLSVHQFTAHEGEEIERGAVEPFETPASTQATKDNR